MTLHAVLVLPALALLTGSLRVVRWATAAYVVAALAALGYGLIGA